MDLRFDVSSKVSLKTIQKLARHSDVRLTMICTQVNRDEQAETNGKMKGV